MAARWICFIGRRTKLVNISEMESGIFIFSHSNLFVEDLFPQPHKVAVITGGNRGIGLAVLKKLLECQMTVMMGVRNPEECMKIVEKSFDESLVKGKVFCARCDTSEMNSVKAFAQQVKEKFPAVHILINNGKFNLYPINHRSFSSFPQLAFCPRRTP